MDSITKSLVDFTIGVNVSDVPQEAVDEVKRRLTDAFGCAIAGFDSPPVGVLRRLIHGREVNGGALVWGTSLRTTPELATLINATAVRSLDFNDHILGGHPSDNIPGIVAACETAHRDIKALIAGVLVNYEVFGELGRLRVREKGWDQGTTGVIASTCAVSKVLGLTASELASAIGIASISNISTRRPRRGQLSMWKGVATPYAAQCGVLAAHLAAAGMTGPNDVFEGEDGFWQMVQGPFEIEDLGDPTKPKHIFRANYKYWPVEFNGQLAVWLGREINQLLNPVEIESINVETHYWAWHEIASEPEKWAPTTRETADHSLPYTLAVSVIHGRIGLEHYTPASLADLSHKDLMSKISVKPTDELTRLYPENYIMRATVRTTKSRSVEFEVREPKGRYTNPMTDGDIRDKYNRLVMNSGFTDRGQELLRVLEQAEDLADVSALLAPLEVASQ